jgi:BMFP domain-containing protein YqiC
MHPAFIVNHGSGADADENIVRLVVRTLEKMDVIRRNDWNI